MKTTHHIYFKNSKTMEEIPSEHVNLVVTSPPYPMIEMWDELFSSMNPEIENAILNENGMKAYHLMNEELNKVWKEVDRVMAHGGIVAINIGDATRKIGNNFQLYSNHSKIINCFEKMGYQVLPSIIWRKQTNKPNKFMGSGMLPPNAYVTLEHEHVLIFRKTNNRNFNNEQKIIRRNSSYFWEERNVWFSDIWTDLKGISQKLNNENLRKRNAAYPFELAYRLINMYSVQDDVVLDPFLGTGTTTMAATCLARNSIGYEIDPNFKEVIKPRFQETLKFAEEIVLDRINDHLEFAAEREKEKGKLKHSSEKYGFSVVTNQEKNILFQIMKDYNQIDENNFEVYYNEHCQDYSSHNEFNINEISKKKEKQRKLI
ncbi:site-specific DNA-methyltransferase [Methanobacterium sp.]|uniref:DNA-methyltransferase n=1 Tax=Methanobacterium sp. TaxID=2164 RepID=UPI002ABAB311|nr:site-specific DNA-methyltransferase [Methanobacterium sp.]MDY9924371.1 site-specific DNA-methyltransferase [Methanobacterium sp.]